MQEDNYDDIGDYTEEKEDNALEGIMEANMKNVGILMLASIVCVLIDCYLEE